MRRNILLLLTAFGLIISLITLAAQLTLVLHADRGAQHVTAKASDSGIVSFCLNSIPEFNFTCNSTMSQNTSYYCRVNATDAQGDNITFSMEPFFFNITPNGTINFTPRNQDVGNYTVRIYATDNSGCPWNQNNYSFNVDVENINDPPYLIQPLPDTEFPANTTVSAFFLTDYFADPDGDPMTFNVTTTANINVTIFPSSEVRLTGQVCDAEELVIFTATDPYNASGASNAVELKIKCNKDDDSKNGGGKGGGGGGGGGAICKPKWECQEWFPCLPNNEQWRRCYDLAGCKGEKYLTRTCLYEGPPPVCQENWLCDEWGQCQRNSTQYRSCKDLAQCGSAIAVPPQEQKCVYIATCNDDVKNGDETGVDCGGSCAACALTEQPAQLSSRFPPWLLMLIIMSVLLVSGVIHYYRSQIAQGIALLNFLLKHRTYKDILLDGTQRRTFFERLLAFEQLMASPAGKQMKPASVYNTLGMLMRQYYVEGLGLHQEALPEEVHAACQRLGLRPETTAMLNTYFSKLPVIEQQDLELDEVFVLATVEELRTIVCLTSEYQMTELNRTQEELVVNDQMSFYDEIYTRMINAMRAAQFNQLETAKQEYLTILAKYDALNEAEKEQIYPEIRSLFGNLKFQSEITGAKIVQKPAA